MGTSNPMKHEPETVPCETCGRPTPMLGTKRCDDCREVETRLAAYVARGGVKARRFVRAILVEDPDGGL